MFLLAIWTIDVVYCQILCRKITLIFWPYLVFLGGKKNKEYSLSLSTHIDTVNFPFVFPKMKKILTLCFSKYFLCHLLKQDRYLKCFQLQALLVQRREKNRYSTWQFFLTTPNTFFFFLPWQFKFMYGCTVNAVSVHHICWIKVRIEKCHSFRRGGWKTFVWAKALENKI